MKHNLWNMKIVLVWLLVIGICFNGSFVSFADETEVALTETDLLGYELLCENDKLEVYGADTGDFAGMFVIKSKLDGSLKYSSPVDWEQDYITLNLMRLKSMIAIEYYDKSTDSLVEANSAADSVNAGGLSIKKGKNSATFIFDFSEIGITIPVEIIAQNNGSLKTLIDVEKIQETGKYKLFTITLLPYFLAENTKESGFIFLPDGSGAVMNFNNEKLNYAQYSTPVYGGDYGEIPDEKIVNAQRITMPVFGISSGKNGIFTVISKGAAQSTISATTSGIDSCYNAVCNSFEIRSTTTYSLDQGWQGKKVFNVFQETKPTVKKLENTYYFLNESNNDLGGMAGIYREYLIENGLKSSKNTEPRVYVDYLGAVMQKKAVLGFPASVKTVITNFEEAQKITQSLIDKNIDNLAIRYFNWDTESITGNIVNSAKPDKKLGGKNGFKKLEDYLEKNHIEFYPDVNPTKYSKNSIPFSQFTFATRNLNKEVNKYYPYKLNLYTKDKERTPYYLLSLTKIEKTFEKFLKSYKKLGTNGMSLSGITSYVTADYNSKNKIFGVSDGEKIYSDIIGKASKERNLLLDDANMSSAIYAEHIVNVKSDSGYDMLDYGVPFYQMALAGLVNLAGEPINLATDTKDAFLQAIESGSGLHYVLSYNASTNNIGL